MTTVEVFRQSGCIVGFEASGHTGYAEEGADIVCSAVSALTTAAVNGLTDILHLPVAVDSSDGRLYCMLGEDVAGTELEKAGILFETMVLGLSNIALTYGDYINIAEREV